MSHGPKTLPERIESVRDQVESLKCALLQERTRIDDDWAFTVDHDFVNIGVQPRVRRTLKGHFGKVYSLHWSGNGYLFIAISHLAWQVGVTS